MMFDFFAFKQPGKCITVIGWVWTGGDRAVYQREHLTTHVCIQSNLTWEMVFSLSSASPDIFYRTILSREEMIQTDVYQCLFQHPTLTIQTNQDPNHSFCQDDEMIKTNFQLSEKLNAGKFLQKEGKMRMNKSHLRAGDRLNLLLEGGLICTFFFHFPTLLSAKKVRNMNQYKFIPFHSKKYKRYPG